MSGLSYRYGLWLLSSLLASCAHEQTSPPVSPVQPEQLVLPAATLPPQQTPVESAKIAWTGPPTRRLGTSITGRPVLMAPGERCLKFRTLPAVEYQHNTLVQDACLEIPDNTTITIPNGITLGIVATNGLRIGRNVRFSAQGSQGYRGERADFGSIMFSPTSDLEIQLTCIDNGNQCTCPSGKATASAIRGHNGRSGFPGGSLHLVLGALTSRANLAGLEVDVSGGRGGPPGESGRQDCKRGNIQCSSQACTDGANSGPPGQDGHVYVAIGGNKSVELLRILSAAITPATSVTAVPIVSNAELQSETRALNVKAYENDWDRRSGEVPF